MSNPTEFKTVSRDKYTADDLKTLDSFQPQEKKFGRETLSVSISRELKVWLDDLLRYLNRQSKRKITRSEATFLALHKLKTLSYEQILEELRNL